MNRPETGIFDQPISAEMRIAQELKLIAQRNRQLNRSPEQQAAADLRLADRLASGSDYLEDKASFRSIERVLPLQPLVIRAAEQLTHGRLDLVAIDHLSGWVYAVCCRVGDEEWYPMRARPIQVGGFVQGLIAGHGWADVRCSMIDAQRHLEDIKADIDRPTWGLGTQRGPNGLGEK